MNKLKLVAISGISAVATFLGLSAGATTTTPAVITTTMGGVLDNIVEAIISTITSFLTNNLPIIIILGLTISLVFWLVYKARRATHGG